MVQERRGGKQGGKRYRSSRPLSVSSHHRSIDVVLSAVVPHNFMHHKVARIERETRYR